MTWIFPDLDSRTFGEIFRDVIAAGADIENVGGKLTIRNGKRLNPVLVQEIVSCKTDLQDFFIRPGENLHRQAEACFEQNPTCDLPPRCLCLCEACPRWTDPSNW